MRKHSGLCDRMKINKIQARRKKRPSKENLPDEIIKLIYRTYLKEQLREIWTQINKDEAEMVMLDWVRQAQESKVPQLMKMAATIMAHRTGILAWYDCLISTGKVEGFNNKIKVMKWEAYGFWDERYFELRLYALHDCRITRNVG